MRESIEFRIPEENAAEYLPKGVGDRLGDSVRKVVVYTDEALFSEIGRLQKQFRKRGSFFFLYSSEHRTYSQCELDEAELFHVWSKKVFEPAGEECGTDYDESTACPVCGAGTTQKSELRLDLRKAPRTVDFAETIAGERIVSQRLAECLTDAGLQGFVLPQVVHKARYEDDPVDLCAVPTGRKVMKSAERAGVPHPSWSFWVWANRAENRPMLDKAMAEYAAQKGIEDQRRRTPVPSWYQLVVKSPAVELSSLTRAGEDPFDDESNGRCPRGHVAGLNLLSEVTITRASRPQADVMETRQMVGIRRGLLRPRPVLLLSVRAWKAIEAAKVKGFAFDVARVA